MMTTITQFRRLLSQIGHRTAFPNVIFEDVIFNDCLFANDCSIALNPTRQFADRISMITTAIWIYQAIRNLR
jgi:hypothetical protein